jgi:hypothetical protein
LQAISDTLGISVGRKLLAMVIKDTAGKEKKVPLRSKAGQVRSITLNSPAKTEDGIPYLENDVTRMLSRVALADVPNNSSHRQQRMKDLVEYAKSLPPELQAIFSDIVIAASDLPDKDIIADRIRKATGQSKPVDPQSASPEELAELQQEQQQAQAAAQRQAELEELAKDEQRAKTEKMRADAEAARATTGNTRIDAVTKVVSLVKGTPDQPGGEGQPDTPGTESTTMDEFGEAAQIVEASERPQQQGPDRMQFGAGLQ